MKLLIKVKDWKYGFKRGMRNLKRYFMLIWQDEDFDYGYLLSLMQRKLGYMETFFLEGKTFTREVEKHGKDIKVARMLLDRIIKDDYSDLYFKSISNMKRFRHHDYLKKQDVDYLFKLMNRKILTWWD